MTYNRATLVRKVQRILDEKPSLTLREISTRLKVSRQTILAAFREQKGSSFRRFKREHLRKTALKLLRDSTLSIKEISFELGYHQPRNFSRFIKNSTSKTPEEIRQQKPRSREGD